MKTVIRALVWAIYIFWIILIFFSATAVYSGFQLANGFRFGEPQTSTFDGTVTTSLPLHIDNIGIYDITSLNLTTLVSDDLGTPISESSTLVPLIIRGENSSITHNITLNLHSMNYSQLSQLLFVDRNLTVDTIVSLNYARVIPFVFGTNLTMPWGAPLSNLTLGHVSINGTNVTVPFSFENHSFFELNGTIRLEIIDNLGSVVGLGTSPKILAPPQGNPYSSSVIVSVSGNPADVRTARLYFQTTVFNYGPVVIPLV